ncbi:cache domain-containing protein [Acuticoccus kandeliae]|uniref:cache domain-containing protein n=1 Tax=Acuticoccus kandeliae TaxID=2073160 RepID=UPI000D3E82B6|nr:cache domain-containing protein [Acuticoccus kandeliae]
MANGANRFPGLGATVFVFVLGLTILLGLAGAALVFSTAEKREEAALAEAIAARGRGLEMTFLRSLHDSWRRVDFLAQEIGAPGATPDLRGRLADLTNAGSWSVWAGYAGLDGLVEAASGGLLEGVSVAARPWYSQGLEGPYAGDAHEAVLLSERLGQTASDPLRFIDLAAPVLGPNRRPVGVLGIHIDLSKARERFQETAESLGIQAFLVNAGGDIVIASQPLEIDRIDTPSLRAARVGAGRPFVETWPDGAQYMTVVLDDLEYRDLPSFGWSLVIRMPMDALAADQTGFARRLAVAGAIGLAAVVLLTLLYTRLYIRPVTRVADSATAIAAGEDVYPYESRRTREVAALSGAIALLQSRSGHR